MKTKLLIFIPSIEGGGVEKNLFIDPEIIKSINVVWSPRVTQ